jgi:hypothetical protein
MSNLPYSMKILLRRLPFFSVEEVYVNQAPRFGDKDKDDKVYKFHKSLYGLRHTAKA